MNGKQLKNSILQWAIQGKLVPQDANDEPAIELLKRIRDEKDRLVKEGKIKKDKNESVIFRGEDGQYYEKTGKTTKCIQEEIPFDIPDDWEWCRVRDISKSYIGLTYKPSDVSNEGIIVLRSSNIKEGKLLLNDIVRVDIEIPSKLYVEKNDIIICARNGSQKLVGKSTLIDEISEPMTFGAFMAICKTSLYHYVYVFLQTECFFSQLRNVSGTTTINQLTQNNFNNFLIPLPPLAEQKRIVAKIEELMPLVERYTKAQEELDKLNAGIKGKLRASILQEAIQGHLVPQDPNDEPAIKLLKRINPKLQPTTKDVPFDVPKSWVWAMGKKLFLPMTSIKPQGNFIYIDVDAVSSKKHHIDKPKFLSKEKAPSRATRKLHCNDVLFSMVRPYLKKIALVTEEFKDAIASTGFYVITPSVALFPKYLYYLMLSDYVVYGLNSFIKGDNSPSINNKHIEDFLFPLPPLAEQKRIVAKIEELFAMLGDSPKSTPAKEPKSDSPAPSAPHQLSLFPNT